MMEQDPPQALEPSGQDPDRQRIAECLRKHREEILQDWERTVRGRHPEHGVSDSSRERIRHVLDQLVDAAANAPDGWASPELLTLSGEHALERLEQGYEPGEVVFEYGLLRGCVLKCLEREGAGPIAYPELSRLDTVLDQAIMSAVTHYARVRERMLKALERVSQAALESEDVDTFLPRLLRVLMEAAVAVDGASILLREGDRLHLRSAVGIGAEQALAEDLSLPLDQGLTGLAAQGRQPLLVRSAAQHPNVGYELIRELGVRAAYSVPLRHGDLLVGVAHMSSQTVFDFTEADKLLFRTMATRATGFIVQAELARRERQARTEAQRSLAQLDTLLKAAPVGIAFLDRELRFVRLNEALAHINRRSVDYHLGKTFREVVPPRITTAYEPTLRHVLDTGEPVFGHEFSSTDPEGGTHYWLGNYYPVRSESGEVLGLGAVVVDITRQKEVESTLRQTGELREQLIGVLGHDLRNPLNAIIASAWLLNREEDLSDAARRAVGRIHTSAARMTRMISDILDFARSSLGGGLPVHRERVDLHDICRSTLEELQVANAGRRLELDVEGDGWGWWDADRLAQVVGNLVSNALQHGAPDRPVRVRVRGTREDVVLSVHNEGPPIPPEVEAVLFQPFQRGTRGKAATRSIGLGLYIVRQVAQAHGGEVSVRSTEAEGTTFTVCLPRGAPSSEASRGPQPLPGG